MSEICIEGGYRLTGEIEIQGSKNAVLPIMAASVLYPGVTVLEGVPSIQDVWASIDILEYLGALVSFQGKQMRIDARSVEPKEIPSRLGERMRSSVLFLGALLARFGEGCIYRPGGCAIGSRPVDMHLEGLKELGAELVTQESRISAKTHGLKGCEITFSYPSVGATEQVLLAAAGAEGTTILRGCAREPEIEALCCFLVQLGLKIEGVGTGTLCIQRKSRGENICYRIPGDRIAAGTYLAASAITGGQIRIANVDPSHMEQTLDAFGRMGCKVGMGKDWVDVNALRRMQAIPFLQTNPFPAFPTDMQSLFLAMLSVAEGTSILQENVFEGRLTMAASLNQMGADIQVIGNQAVCNGIERLQGSRVMGTDLRCGAGLIVAALQAEGTSRISGFEHVLRGYENLDQILCSIGGKVMVR